jgi:hypothetical protein
MIPTPSERLPSAFSKLAGAVHNCNVAFIELGKVMRARDKRRRRRKIRQLHGKTATHKLGMN